MKKQYLTAFLSLALIFGMFSVVSAQVNTRAEADNDLRASYEARKVEMKALREKVKAEAEARRAKATAKGDEIQAKREAARIELEAKRAEMDAKREAAKVEAEAKRAEARTKRVEFQAAVAKRKVEKVTKVILATIGRLENIIARVESRIAKVKANGGLTVKSEGFVAAAKANLADARAVVGTFANLDLSSEKAAENFEKIRVAAAEAREHIRAAHQNLMLAVRSLGSVKEDLAATTTATSTSNQ